MRRPSAGLCGVAALALILAGACRARADYSPVWSYSWAPDSAGVAASTGDGQIVLTGRAGANVEGSTNLVAANLSAVSGATSASPASFTGAAYGLTLTITD